MVILTPLRNHAKQLLDELLVYSVNKIQSYHRQPQQARVSPLRDVQRGLQIELVRTYSGSLILVRMDEMHFYQSPVANVRGPKIPILGSILREERVFSRKLVGALDARNTGPYAA